MTKKNGLILILFTLALQGVSAHPHMILTNRSIVHWENGTIRGVTLEWEFDRFFSADIMFSYDVDKNGLYDKTETAEVFQYAFSNLKKYNYFVFFREGSRRFIPDRVENFAVRNKDDETLIYSFYLPLDNFTGSELNIAVYDYSFFCHVLYDEENPVEMDFGDKPVEAWFELTENRDYPVYYDPFAPATDMSLHEAWRPGLETFYPTEIQIGF
jgi:ABC-type uncharacterized transport system substrate-binding protein